MTCPQRHPKACSAFTLVETMAALALAGLVSLGSVMMLQSASAAARSQLVIREAMLDQRVASLRAASIFRSAAGLLAATHDRAVLWAGDADASGAPSLPELRYVRFDSLQAQVWVFQPLPTQSEGLYADLDFDDDFLAIAAAAAGSAAMPGALALDDVGGWDVRVAGSDPQAARSVLISATWEQADGVPIAATVIVSFRGARTEADAP